MEIYILNTLETGIDSTNILKKHLDIRGVIGLSKRNTTEKISGCSYSRVKTDAITVFPIL